MNVLQYKTWYILSLSSESSVCQWPRKPGFNPLTMVTNSTYFIYIYIYIYIIYIYKNIDVILFLITEY